MNEEQNPYTPGEAAERGTEENKQMARRVLMPVALSLIVLSILHIFGGLLYFVYMYGIISHPDVEPEQKSGIILYCLYYSITMLYSLVLVFGAFSMMRQGSYLWAMTTCILACIPVLGPCYFFAVPAGLFGIVILRRREVQDTFARM